MGKALAVLALLVGDIGLKNEGVSVGPVNTINCVGSLVDCTRAGSTGVVTIGDGGYYGNSTFIPDGGVYGSSSFAPDGGIYGSFTSDGGTYGDATSASLTASMTRPVVVAGPALQPRRSPFALPPCNAVRRSRCCPPKALGAK